MLVDIAEITVGERHRKSMGDLSGLMASIEREGLLHPVVVTPDNRLIAKSLIDAHVTGGTFADEDL